MKTVWEKNTTFLPHLMILILRKPHTSHPPHWLSQAELSTLIRDLDLSKEKTELLGSRLQQWNLLQRDVSVSKYRKRQRNLLPFFGDDSASALILMILVICYNVNGFIRCLSVNHNATEWRLFINSSQLSLKGIWEQILQIRKTLTNK